MKYVKEAGIIFGMSAAGEILNQLLPFPVPAGVYGLFLLLICLVAGIVKLEWLETCPSCLSPPVWELWRALKSFGPCWCPFW